MKIAYLLERPTQFEAPFFRFAARDPDHQLRVLFTHPQPGVAVFDPELGREIDWEIDLLGGYVHAEVPGSGASTWLRQDFERHAYDLVIVNGYTRFTYRRAAALAGKANSRAALRLDSVRFEGDGRPGLLKRLLYSLVLRRLFHLFLATGSLSLRYLKAVGVPEERTALFPYAVDVEDFRRRSAMTAAERAARRSRLEVPVETKVVLSLSKLNEREAPWDLLEAVARMDDPDLWLVVAGDGPSRVALEQRACAQALSQVRFLGYVPYRNLPTLYGACDLFVHAPQEERWGVSVAEALASGLPVVASSRVGAAHDLIEPGRNGDLYQVGDADELAARLTAALSLDAEGVQEANREILARWDYAATWRHLLEAAARSQGR